MNRSFSKRKNKLFGLFLFSVLGAGIVAKAADEPWAVSKISPELLKNANAVLRLEELHFEMVNTHHTIFRNHYVITVLDESGDHWAKFSEYYNKFRSIVAMEGTLYDASGKEIRKTKNKDFEDISAVSDNNLIDDTRVKQHNFYYKVFPYTIEYDVVVRSNSSLFFPDWVPQGSEKLSVEKSMVIYTIPESYQLRYKAYHYQGEPISTVEKGRKSFKWFSTDMPAFLKEPFQPPIHEIRTYVAFAPSEFEVDDYKGNMASWQDFGKFVYTLKAGKEELPPTIRQKVQELTAGLADPNKKIQVLYEFLQKNTRYVSIQLGIGGWKPFDASYVASKGYGDCKALTNFMYSLLKEAGIHSDYTLVRAGRNIGPINHEFPSQQFNHVILSVPLQKDTVWLECTSQTLPAGYLSDFTCDRFALVVNEEGGKLVRTPRYGIRENLQVRNIRALLDEDAVLQVRSSTVYKGLQQDHYHELIHGLSKDKLKEFLQDELDFATYDINDFEYKPMVSSSPFIREDLSITVSNYANLTGKRLFIVPNVMTRKRLRLLDDPDRKFDIFFNYEFRDIDTVEIELPSGYIMESVPQDIKIHNQFGKYNCSYKLEGNRIVYLRELEQYSGRFPAKDFSELVKFNESIYKADRARMVLVKN